MRVCARVYAMLCDSMLCTVVMYGMCVVCVMYVCSVCYVCMLCVSVCNVGIGCMYV